MEPHLTLVDELGGEWNRRRADMDQVVGKSCVGDRQRYQLGHDGGRTWVEVR